MVVPDGYALVPIDPTPEMIAAGVEAYKTDEKWRAMLAAAPTFKAEQVQCEECGGNGAGGDHEDDCSKALASSTARSA